MADGYSVRAILDSEREECLEMLDRAFDGTPNGYFVRYFEGDPDYKNDYCRVYPENGRIVSSLHICRREVRVGLSRLVMGGLANVGTEPDHRGKGYSSEVLRDSARFMNEDEMDFSILYTGINAFYDRLGWRTLPVPYLFGKLEKSVAAANEERYGVRVYNPDEDAPALLKVYEEFSGAMLMSAVRSEFRWRNFTMHKFHPPWRIMLAEDDSGIVAYTVSKIHNDTLIFDELGFSPGHEAALSLLMKQDASDAISQGAREVSLEPATHPAVTAIAAGIADELEIRHQTGGMVMFFDLERTFGRLLPELARRVKAIGLNGSVAIKTEIGGVALKADGSTIEIANPSSQMDEAKLTQPDLARLIFGIGQVEGADSSMSNNAREFLDRLFPSQPFVYWITDKF
ncbi:MAG: GNAT family N-acetyltransferase [Armatimonadota bacterium]|nr:GNAT family N-acetyltransferase [Armatimonadota bacterium]